MEYVIAIDLGTSGCRSSVFDEHLNMCSMASVETPIHSISSREIEQDPEDWWNGLVQTVREATERSGIPAERIRALSISSQSISVVPVDASGAALRSAISWLDTRPLEQMEQLQSLYDFKELYHITGKRLNSIYTLPKLMWIQQRQPDIAARTAKYLLPLDYLIFRLCGRFCTDHSCAAGTMYYDVEAQTWAEGLLRDCDLSSGKLPEILWSGTAVGTLLPEVAALLGLRGDTVVAMGAQDQKCASLGAGLSKDCITVSLGTAACIEALLDRPARDAECRIPLFSYLHPKAWVMEGLLSSGCVCYSWMRDILGPGASFARMDEQILSAPPQDRPVFFYPFLSGDSSPNWREDCGHFARLSLATTAGHMARSVLEGIACALRTNLCAIENLIPDRRELHLFGGGAKNPLFCQIISDVTGRDVATYRHSEAALAGAAMLAMQSIGLSPGVSLPIAARYAPVPEQVAAYDRYYQEYEELRARLYP